MLYPLGICRCADCLYKDWLNKNQINAVAFIIFISSNLNIIPLIQTPLQSLHRFSWIFHWSKQCLNLSSESMFMVSIFLLWLLQLCQISFSSLLVTGKSHPKQGLVIRVDVTARHYYKKTWHWCSMGEGIVLMKNPRLVFWQLLSPSSFL